MNREEAKDILLLYRHHNPADEEDPIIIEALALAKSDPELAGWLEMHCARQFVLTEKFRQIPVPEGLKEQIVSEHSASRRIAPKRLQHALTAVLAIVMVITLASAWVERRQPLPENTLPVFQSQMARYALSGYSMDLLTNDAGKIRDYLKAMGSTADYILSGSLQQTAQSGCAIEGWQDRKVTMVCFRTGRPLAAGTQSDMWLFVVDQTAVQDAPVERTPRISRVNKLVTATWVRNGKLYFLGMEGEAADLQKYL